MVNTAPSNSPRLPSSQPPPTVSNPPSWEAAVAVGAYGTVELAQLAADHGTPSFVYAADLIDAACTKITTAAKPLHARLRYAVKANGNLAVLRRIKAAGLGFDIASAVEFARSQHAGALPGEVVFTGPGKSAADLQEFIRASGEEIICDSAGELARIIEIAAACSQQVTVGLRVNPAIEAGGNPNIATGMRDSKFGLKPELALELLSQIAAHADLQIGSINCHIGSQIAEDLPYRQACDLLLELSSQLAAHGCQPQLIDLGGGFAIGDAHQRPAQDVFAQLCKYLATNFPDQAFGFQPGRSIVGRAGILLTRVEYVKDNHIIVDAGMTELLRPALYDSVHGIAKVGHAPAGAGEKNVVGPVCENTDWLVKGCDLDVSAGELVALFDAGAYGAAMMSGYNGRLRACELMLADGAVTVARRRETVAEVLAAELD